MRSEKVMEQRWLVECWGEFSSKYGTELFYTKIEAEKYFKQIRRQLDSSRYIISRDSIIDSQDDGNIVCITDLDDID